MPPRLSTMPTRLLPLIAAGLSGAVIAALEIIAARLLLPATGGGPGVFLPVLFFFAAIFPIGAEIARSVGARPSRYRYWALAALLCSIPPLFVVDPLRAVFPGPTPLAVVAALSIGVGPLVLLLSATVPLLSPRPGGAAVATISNLGALIGIGVGVGAESLLSLGSVRVVIVLAGALALLLVASLMQRARVVRAPVRRPFDTGSMIAIAAVASASIGATSTLLTADVGGLPILWALPLAAYFAAWSVAFAPSGPLALLRSLLLGLAPAGALLMMAAVITPERWPIPVAIALVLLALFSVATALLTRLAEAMPAEPTRAATAWRSIGIGGAGGAALTAVVAPIVLPEMNELAVVGAAALLLLSGSPSVRRLGWASVGPLIAAGALLLPLAEDPAMRGSLTLFAAAAIAAVLLLPRLPSAGLAAGGIAVVIALTANPNLAEWRGRSLIGPLSVQIERPTSAGEPIVARTIISGRTVHGSELLEPTRYRGEATTYYHRLGPVGDLMAITPRGRVAIVGMGAGTMAVYATSARAIDFVEIDGLVIEAARTRFGYIAAADGEVVVHEAEGRSYLASAAAGGYEMVVIDAFNGDAIPTHLLTAESIAKAMRVLRPNGVVAFHVSNRIFDLPPAIAATAATLGLSTRVVSDVADPGLPPAIYSPSEWVVVGSAEALADLPPRWEVPRDGGVVLLDDRVDLFALFRR
jgi:spermidine synthase